MPRFTPENSDSMSTEIYCIQIHKPYLNTSFKHFQKRPAQLIFSASPLSKTNTNGVTRRSYGFPYATGPSADKTLSVPSSFVRGLPKANENGNKTENEPSQLTIYICWQKVCRTARVEGFNAETLREIRYTPVLAHDRGEGLCVIRRDYAVLDKRVRLREKWRALLRTLFSY